MSSALTCDSMDARLDPNAMTGLEVGDAHIIRSVSSCLPERTESFLMPHNAQERRREDGRCLEESDWVARRFAGPLRPLRVSFAVTDLHVTQLFRRERLLSSTTSACRASRRAKNPRAEPIILVDRDCGYSHASTPVIQATLKHRTPESAHPMIDALALQEFKDDGTFQSVKGDVEYLRNHPLIHPDSKDKISGWWYYVKNGELKRVC